LRLLGNKSERRIAKPLYAQKVYRGFESPSLRQILLNHPASDGSDDKR